MISLLVMTENRQFHSFIIITMILIATHDSAIRWEEVLGAGWSATSDRKAGVHTAAPEATRPLLLFFTDGADTSSLLLADGVLESVRHPNLRVHAVSFGYQRLIKPAMHEAGGRV